MATLSGVFNGSQILLRSGEIRPIELVSEGDEVISHTGAYSRIQEKLSRRYSGTYLVLDTLSPFSSLRVTPGQSLLTFPYYGELDPVRKGLVKWVAAGDLTPDTYILLPWPAVQQNPKYKTWIRTDAAKLAEVGKFTTALGMTRKVKTISILEETDLRVHRLVLVGEGSFIASGAAVQA